MSDGPPFDEPCVVGGDEWLRRLALFVDDDGPLRWWWMSFCDTDLPASQQHLGVVIVPGGNAIQAIAYAHALGVNPGGEVASFELPHRVRPEHVGRLFVGPALDDLRALEPEQLMVIPPEER